MKKGLFIASFLLSLLSTYAANPSVITGSWDRGNDTEVKLFRTVAGRLEELSSYKMQNDKRFGFAFEAKEEGFYVVGSGNSIAAMSKYLFYFKPGDKLDIAVNDSTYTLIGQNTSENTTLAKWHDFMYLMEMKSIYVAFKFGRVNGASSTYVDFFPLLEESALKAKNYVANTGNKKFDQVFPKIRDFNFLHIALLFNMMPRTVHPEALDYTDFYKNIDMEKLTAHTDILAYPFGVSTIQHAAYTVDKLSSPSQAVEGSKGAEERFKEAKKRMISMVKNDTLRGELLVSEGVRLKTYEEYQAFEKENGKYILTQDQKDRMNQVLVKIAQNKPITETIDFSGTDVNDKKVSLSDLKGKVVVVDVWATWCGPCKREIPPLKAIEKEYHGKDVVFMSISLDEVRDKQKWLDFVKKEELTGLQLFGGNGMASDVAKFYKITAIPRFMVFGKDGKIVTENSPRPSSPDLKKMIDAQLAKK